MDCPFPVPQFGLLSSRSAADSTRFKNAQTANTQPLRATKRKQDSHFEEKRDSPAAPSYPYDMPSRILNPDKAYNEPIARPATMLGMERVRA